MKINFLTPDLWDACVDVTHRPQLPDSNRADYAGVDIGLKHDNAAIVVVSCTTSGVTLVSHRIRKPTSAQPLDLEQTIEAFLLDWHQRGWLVNCFIDPYQAHRSVITLKGQGVAIMEFPQAVPRKSFRGHTGIVQYLITAQQTNRRLSAFRYH